MLFETYKQKLATIPGSSGIRQNGKLHTYTQLAERAEHLASGLAELGIGRGDVVIVLMRNSPDAFVLIHALLGIGAISTPLDVQGNPAELLRLIEQMKVRAVVAAPEFAAVGQQLAESAGVTMPLILSHGEGTTLAELEKSPIAILPKIDPDDVAFYLFSSGSTGRQKVVPRTHGQLLSDFNGSAGPLGFGPDDLMINLLPVHHAFGITIGVIYAPLIGTSTLLWAPNKPLFMARGDLLQAIANEGVTLLPGVPFLFDMLLGATEQVQLNQVRMAFSGAVALRKPTFDGFYERFGIAIRQALGTTETSVVTYNLSDDPVATWNSVGSLIGENRIEIVPAEESPDPNVGELLISSPAVAKEYLNNPEATAASFRNGAWVSGDLGRVDPDGNYYLLGRKKLMVDVAGLKVDPVEVEDVLMGHPAVAEAVVVGVPDPRTGEQRLKAVVVKKADETADAIVSYARAHLSSHKVPYLVQFIEAIPRSATGKVLRGKLID